MFEQIACLFVFLCLTTTETWSPSNLMPLLFLLGRGSIRYCGLDLRCIGFLCDGSRLRWREVIFVGRSTVLRRLVVGPEGNAVNSPDLWRCRPLSVCDVLYRSPAKFACQKLNTTACVRLTALACAAFSSGEAFGSKCSAVEPAFWLSSSIMRWASSAETVPSWAASSAPRDISSLLNPEAMVGDKGTSMAPSQCWVGFTTWT